MNPATASSQQPRSPTPGESRDISSLDGLRAFSILLVMLAHATWYFPEWIGQSFLFRMAIGSGAHGVAIFFVISGYLITTLLRREYEKLGSLSLKHFYFRRSLRIFPPFYAFLAVMGVLWAAKIIPEHWPSFLAATTYTWAYYAEARGYFIAHSWSLSVEEQFYLFWPVLFLWGLRRARLMPVTLLCIFGIPIVRVLLYFIAPGLRGHEGYMVQGWIDTILVGCLLALLRGQSRWEAWHRRYLNGLTASALVVSAFLIIPWVATILPKRPAGLFSLLMSPTLKAICIGGFMIYLIENRNAVIDRLFNNSVIRHVGVLSYSLYLWQQLFLSREFAILPYGFLCAFVAAELSLWMVEKPSLRLRARLQDTKKRAHA